MKKDRPTHCGPAPVRGSTDGLSPARARILEYLQEEPAATTVMLIAEATGLHANTAREHLDGLVSQGLAERSRCAPAGRGRPCWLYVASPANREPDARVQAFAELVGALAEHIEQGPDPQAQAIAAGSVWGRARAQARPASGDRLDEGPGNSGSRRAQHEVVEILSELSFDPVADRDATSVALRRCPLLDLAREYPDVVCAIHLGLVRAVLEANGADPDTSELLAFGEPDACRLNMAANK